MTTFGANPLPPPSARIDSAEKILPPSPQLPTPPGPTGKVNEIARANIAANTPLSLTLPDSKSGVKGSSSPDLPQSGDPSKQLERTYLAAYKALHLGGKETAESRLIRSELLPVYGKIEFSPPTLKLELSLFEEIQKVLSRDFDLAKTPISRITLISEPERRNRLMRIEFEGSDKSVMFKESHPIKEDGKPLDEQSIQETYDRFSRDWAGLEFVSTLQKEFPLCPQCYGGSEKHRFVLMEDLGAHHVSLATHLVPREGEEKQPSVAKESLGRFMKTLGHFHAAGHDKIDQYLNILHKINPEAPEISLMREIETKIHHLNTALDLLGIPQSAGLEEEVRNVIVAASDPKGPFATVTHGDPCPDNMFDFPNKLLLIDFEHAIVRNALMDATYPRMNMPTGWCAGMIPEEFLVASETTYRKELMEQIPAAKDDKTYFEAYTQACAMHILKRDMEAISWVIKEDEIWGIASERSRILTHLETFIEIAEKYDTLPVLKDTAKEILAALKTRWEDAKPLGLYAAFR